MNLPKDTDETTLNQRIRDEMADSLDEELEMEIDDGRLDRLVAEVPGSGAQDDLDRPPYLF